MVNLYTQVFVQCPIYRPFPSGIHVILVDKLYGNIHFAGIIINLDVCITSKRTTRSLYSFVWIELTENLNREPQQAVKLLFLFQI